MKLTTNESTIDRVVRIALGIGLAGLAIVSAMAAPVLYVVGLIAAVLLITGIVGFCPLYAALGISTRRAAR